MKDFGGTCWAYVSYDSAFRREPIVATSPWRFRALLDVVDITDGSAPDPIVTWGSQATTGFHNDFSTQVAAAWVGNGVGYFWYRQQNSDPCNTTFVGATDPFGGVFNMVYTGDLSSSSFQSIRFPDTSGLGHYVAAQSRGVSGGMLFPSWAQGVDIGFNSVGQGCAVCQMHKYTKRVFGVTLAP